MRFLVLLLMLTSLSSCKKGDIEPINYGSTTQYLSHYPAGEISVKSPITLRFKDSIEMEERSHLLTIEPTINGKAEWTDAYTMVWIPETPLRYGKEYQLTIHKKGWPKPIKIPVKTKDLNFSMQLDPHPIYTAQGIDIKGTIKISDWVSAEKIKGLIKQDDQKISWNHLPQGRVHEFIIKDIPRSDKASEFTLEWQDFESDFKGSVIFPIAPAGLFEIISISPGPGHNEVKNLFSDLVDKTQDLSGLIKINSETVDYQYDIEGSILYLDLPKMNETSYQIEIPESIRSARGKLLSRPMSREINREPTTPGVKLVTSGTITPHDNTILFPFEAKGLNAVDVEILKVYSDNILQYLQNHRLSGQAYYLENVGRIIHQEKVFLNQLKENPDYDDWNRYVLDLNEMISPDPGALYHVRIGFRGSYSDYPCVEEIAEEELSSTEPFISIMRWNSRYDSYRYDHQDNPCYPVYYNSNRFIKRAVLASNLGIIAKGDDKNRFSIHIQDLNSLISIPEAQLRFYDFQQQEIINGITDLAGNFRAELSRRPSFIIAKRGQEYGSLNLRDEYSNSLSDFDIGGKEKKEGMNGFFYGERGVWRPGDTTFLTFVLEDEMEKLPKGYPIQLQVKDSRGQVKYEASRSLFKGNIYSYAIPTEENDPTGNWTASAKIGKQLFYKSLTIETVKPNRLRVSIDIEQNDNLSSDLTIPFSSNWLFGAPASGLKARIEATFQPSTTAFSDYSDYRFDDPSRKVNAVTTVVHDAYLDQEGKGLLTLKRNEEFFPPGMVDLRLRTRIFEKTGEFSEDNLTQVVSPYSSYVGLQIPENPWGRKTLSREEGMLSLVVVNQEGKPVADRKLSIGLYEAEWSWWYNRTNSNIYRYDQANHLEAIVKAEVVTDKNGSTTWRPESLSGYRYMIRVCDTESGHCTGELFYTPYYDLQSNDGAASILHLKTERERYSVGEKILFEVPSNVSSKILVSVESGQGVLSENWYDGQEGSTRIEIEASAEMTPNVYAHVMLVQAYDNEISDLPLRMYGVVPFSVQDPTTLLSPRIDMEEELRPMKPYSVTVSENNSEEMFYTLAIVDEGLLGLTRYKTPDLHNHFYAKRALGVKTWDIYDDVIQAYGGSVDRYISIGGDAGSVGIESSAQQSRFHPVVQFVGPFHLAPGEKRKHTFTMDNYVGAVRAMVVGRNGDHYGNAEQTSTVSNPIMVLATAPRTLAPEERFTLPINVFANKDNIRMVDLQVAVGSGLRVLDNIGRRVDFVQVGEQVVSYVIEVDPGFIGPTSIKIWANSANESISQEIFLQVQNPNPLIYQVVEENIDPNIQQELRYSKIGMEGTQQAILELSSFPALNLDHRLNYLIRYPYGCIEQTTSSGFPQLFLENILALSAEEREEIKHNISAAINRIQKFQAASGAFSYWPGMREPSDWGTSYAGHFLIEAKSKGYYVADPLLGGWLRYQRESARMWRNEDNVAFQYLMQAYRLYTLSKAGHPEWPSMNAMRAEKLPNHAAYTLAAAYAVSGQTRLAEEIWSKASLEAEEYIELSHTYGSGLRDRALMVESLLSGQGKISNNVEAKILEIARELGSQEWYSTQTTAFALLVVGKYLKEFPAAQMDAVVDFRGQQIKVGGEAAIFRMDLDYGGSTAVQIRNQSRGRLYARITQSGQALYGEIASIKDNLQLKVRYINQDQQEIDPSSIVVGTDFIAEISIINPGTRAYRLEEMALNQAIPSGWEIRNQRLSGQNTAITSDAFTYQDIRDTEIRTFFDMKKRKTFRVGLTAAYSGKYYLPDIQCEAMYDHRVVARVPGKWVTVLSNPAVQ